MSPQQIAMAASILKTTPGTLAQVLQRGMKPETTKVNEALLEALKGLLKATSDLAAAAVKAEEAIKAAEAA
jgi:hypothetical protein